MRPLFVVLALPIAFLDVAFATTSSCRNVPGDAGYPTDVQWAALNSSVSGHLVTVVPSAKFCRSLPSGFCTDAQWSSAVFRNGIPGAMNQVNFESDWDSNPPSLCLRNSTACGQGNTPLFAILAESVGDIQAGLKFSLTHNLRLSVKSSGHDFLGRSTAKNSLMISTHKLKSIQFTDDFRIGGKSKGPAITVGSGVSLSEIYIASGAHGKIVVGGTASTVAAAGGYVQGAGHSAVSPLLGLAADNCHELKVVLANGTLATANEDENSDLFWAMRGGGAGSWGVIVSATFRTFPTFDIALSLMNVSVPSFEIMGKVITAHAKHIFDWDSLHAGQYFYIYANASNTFGPDATGPLLQITTFFPRTSITQAEAALAPFIAEARLQGATVTNFVLSDSINHALTSLDDDAGGNFLLGSRLVDSSMYRRNPALFGKTYVELLDAGAQRIFSHLVAGGQVSVNANVSNAVNPKWRTAKTHVIVVNSWSDSTPVRAVRTIETSFRDMQLPILQKIAPPGAGAYTNEADPLEPDFRTTFYGPNYAKLSKIKAQYDPNDLFIVRSGVGSERWDGFGLCRVL